MNSLTATEPLQVQWSQLAEHAKANAEEFVEISYTLADQLRSRNAQEALRVVQRAYEVVPLIHERMARLRASLKCYRLLADVYFRLGNLNRCQQYLLSAFEVLEAVPLHIEPIFFQYIYNIQGVLDSALGQQETAIKSFQKALEYAEKVDDLDLQLAVLLNLGISYGKMGQTQNAIDTLNYALARDPDRVANSRHHILLHNNLAFAYEGAKSLDLAYTHVTRGIELLNRHPTPELKAALYSTLAKIYTTQGELKLAYDTFQEARAVAQTSGQKQTESRILRGLAEVEWKLGYQQAAVTTLETLLKLGGIHKDLQLDCYQLLATYLEELGDTSQAFSYYKRYHTLFAEIINDATQQRIDQLQVVHNTVLARKEAELYRLRSVELEQKVHQGQLEMLERLAVAVKKRDDETGDHMRRVSLLVREVALQLGMEQEDAERLSMAARLHDIGKIAIPDHILLKPAKLTPLEYDIIKRHTLVGAEMLSKSSSPILKLAETIALNHHERWDGQGYPSGLAGEAIPLEGRIVAIVDVFDALISKRTYKEPRTVEDALAELRRCAGSQFDPALVELLCNIIHPLLSEL